MLRPCLLATALMAPAFLTAPALAHQTYMQPEHFISATGETVDISMTSALSYPDVESGPARDRIALTSVTVGSHAIEELSFTENETYLNIGFTPDHPGFAMAATSSKPRSGQIEPEDTSMYLDEIEATDAVRQAFDDLPGEPPLDRSYAKHSKTFFCIETCAAGIEARTQPVGQPLEFTGVEGANDTFVLLLEGVPLAAHSVTIVTSESKSQTLMTSEVGTVHLDAPLRGALMLSAVWLTVPEKADGVYHSDYATLTVDLSAIR